MGAPTARITATDFLIPAEFRAWKLAAHPAGRIGGVRLRLSANNSRTVASALYQQIPLRVLPPFQVAACEPALIYLLNPTAGLMDGDAQLMHISAEAGARAVVTGQSATRIHPGIHGFATQQWHVTVEPGAVLVLLPGPAIPFQGCRYYQRVEVDLAEDAGFVWGDIWFAGRYARGKISEQFQFSALVQELIIRRAGRLVFRDRFCWGGPWDQETAAWHFAGAPACGSLFISGKVSEELIQMSPACKPGVFSTAAADTCLRWLGASEAVIDALVKAALGKGAALAGREPGSFWLLQSDGLAPNHWFSHSRDLLQNAKLPE
jgi:urease accessory protein